MRPEKQIEDGSQRHPSPEVLKFRGEGRWEITSKTPGVVVKLQMISSPVIKLLCVPTQGQKPEMKRDVRELEIGAGGN